MNEASKEHPPVTALADVAAHAATGGCAGKPAVRVNGEWHALPATHGVLMDWLRAELALDSPKPACDTGHCGNCAVLINGRPAKSCTVMANSLVGSEVSTLEEFERNPAQLLALREAFNQPSVFQCGYCKAGFVFACHALLERNPAPTREDIREAFAGILCRCTGYLTIVAAVEQAVQRMRQESEAAAQSRVHRPATLGAALALATRLPRPHWLAGGQHLVPWLRHAADEPLDLVSIEGITALKGISLREGRLHIGACCTHEDIANSALVEAALPVLGEIAGHIGDVYVRARGTLGGAIISHARDGCYPPLLIAAGARVVTATRNVPAEEWFATCDASGELVTGVEIPLPRKICHRNFRQRPGRPALVGVTVVRDTAGTLRIGIAGYAAHAFLAADAEGLMRAMDAGESGSPWHAALGCVPFDDDSASGAYRTAILRELLLRARGDMTVAG